MATFIDVNQPDPASFIGRTAIVTGGSSGIGLATGKLLHSLGCNVVLGDLLAPEKYAEDQTFQSDRICYQKCDITDWDSLLALFEATITRFGSVDIVCANAGVSEVPDTIFVPNPTEHKKPSMRLVDVNVKGTLYTVHHALHFMRGNNNGGSIVMTASMAGYFSASGIPVYTATKHALIGFFRVMAPAALQLGIGLSCICPGLTQTPMIATLLDGVPTTTEARDERVKVFVDQLNAAGTPSQTPEFVSKAFAFLIQKGIKASGYSLFVQGGEVAEIDQGLQDAMPGWLSEKMSYMRRRLDWVH